MKVSIIIPVHKTSQYFIECLNSAINQSYKNLEILIICNGDLTIEECKDYLAIDDVRLKFIKSKEGRHYARNEGLKFAKGEFIQFLDYDDYLIENKIEMQLSELKGFATNTISISQWKKFNNTIDDNYNFPFQEIFTEKLINVQSLIEKLGKGGFIATASWLISKELLNDILWIDSPNDDAVFLSEILKKNPQIIMIPKILAGYRIHQDNTSSHRSKKDLDKLLLSWIIIKKNLINVDKRLVSQYLYRAYEYLLQYSKEVNSYKSLFIFKLYVLYGMNSKVSIFQLLKKGLFILK